MATRKTLANNTVYERRDLDNTDMLATITITGDDVNVYHYIKESSAGSAPANVSEMQADDGNPFKAGAYVVDSFDYIAVVSTGTSTVKSRNLVNE
jgi:hypothetical protein